MKRVIIAFSALLFVSVASAQGDSVLRIDTSSASVSYWKKWSDNLFDMGVATNRDSFFVKPEVVKLLSDSALRQTAYPEKYTWQTTVALMNQLHLKAAFWHMINLYQDDKANRNTVLGTFALYDSLIDMDKALLSAFYTYAFPDPRVTRMEKGKPVIYRPDLLEKGLATTREIAGYIWAYRKEKKGK